MQHVPDGPPVALWQCGVGTTDEEPAESGISAFPIFIPDAPCAVPTELQGNRTKGTQASGFIGKFSSDTRELLASGDKRCDDIRIELLPGILKNELPRLFVR